METLVLLVPSIISVFIYYHYDPQKKSIVYLFYYGIFTLINNALFFGLLYVIRGNEFVIDFSRFPILTSVKYFLFAIAIAIVPTYMFVVLKKKLKLKVEYKDEEI